MDEKEMIRQVLKAYKVKIQNLESDVKEMRKVINKQSEDVDYLSQVILKLVKGG
jgi:wobble nucleotide-excising tRNase